MTETAQEPKGEIIVPEEIKRPALKQVRVVSDNIPILDTGRFEHMQRIASVMASASLIPDHIRTGSEHEAAANCFLIVNQAVRWNMDPFALAQHVYILHGKLGFEGKVIAAAINSDPQMTAPLEYEFFGEEGTDGRGVVVKGTLRDGKERTVEGTLGKWKTFEKDRKTVNGAWVKDPDQMLCYRGARQWARRHNPARVLGVYSEDELDDLAIGRMRDITPRAGNGALPPAPLEPAAALEPPAPPAPPEPVIDAVPDPESYLESLDQQMATASDLDTLNEIWNEHDAHEDGLESEQQARAIELYEAHEKRIHD